MIYRMNFDDLLQKIYSEKDISTNIAIFIASLIGFLVYLFNKDSYLSLIITVGTFSMTKMISSLFIDRLRKNGEQKKRLASYSESEISVIKVFINRGSCFLPLSDLRKGDVHIDQIGFDSLMARRVIEFVERGIGDGPTGFQLDEDLYKSFFG